MLTAEAYAQVHSISIRKMELVWGVVFIAMSDDDGQRIQMLVM